MLSYITNLIFHRRYNFRRLLLPLYISSFFVGAFFSTPALASADTFDDEVVRLINAERQKQNLNPYNNNSKLFQSAQNHNNTMFTCAKSNGVNSCFMHQVTLLNEPNLLSRVQATGYNPKSVSENIAWGYTTPTSVVSGWMNSSGHKANILGSYKDVGCDSLNGLNGSYTGMYWTCNFGTSFSTTSVTPTPTLKLSLTPTPTVKATTPTPTLRPTSTPTPTIKPLITPTPAISTTPSKPWWCVYAPTHYMCK